MQFREAIRPKWIFVLILVLITLSLFLAACETKEEQPSRTGAGTALSEEKEEKTSGEESQAEEAEQITGAAVLSDYDEAVKELMKKSRGRTNYYYTFESLVKVRGLYLSQGVYKIYFKDNKAKKEYKSPVKSGQVYYSEIYLELEEGKAWGGCSSPSVLCEEGKGKIQELDYAQEKIKVIPRELIQGIPMEARKIGEERLDNRKAIILEYPRGDKTERLAVDEYYGLPLRREVLIYENEELVAEEKDYFTGLVVGSVRSMDVNRP